jgi:hypothetical protein
MQLENHLIFIGSYVPEDTFEFITGYQRRQALSILTPIP